MKNYKFIITTMISCSFLLFGCSNSDSKLDAAADKAYDEAYDYCTRVLKRDSGACEIYMEQNWQSFYIEPK